MHPRGTCRRLAAFLLVGCLGLAGPSQAQLPVATVLAGLTDANGKVRTEAARAAATAGYTEAIPGLRQLLDDRQAPVRAAAALALGRLGDEEARAQLVRQLGHANRQVSSAAEQALLDLEQRGQPPRRFFIKLDRPHVSAGIPGSQGPLLIDALDRQLRKSTLLRGAAGEEKILKGPRLTTHLNRRKLKGYQLLPTIELLTATPTAQGVAVKSRVSLVVTPLTTKRIEFITSADASIQATTINVTDQVIVQLTSQALEAAAHGALEQVEEHLAGK